MKVSTKTDNDIPPLASTANVNGNNRSLVIADVPPGDYDVAVTGDADSVSAYKILIYLIDDGDANGVVNADDAVLLCNTFGAILGEPDYRIEVAADQDGRVGSFDLTQAIRNSGAAASELKM